MLNKTKVIDRLKLLKKFSLLSDSVLREIIDVFSARLYGLRSSKGCINDILRKAQDTEGK